MRVLIAPDKFKGSLTAIQACEAIATGIRRADPNVDIDFCPMSDGGEGFVDAMVRATSSKVICARVTGPLPEMKVNANYGLNGSFAFIEMAAASGLHLLKESEYDPTATTTFGTGELINHAIDAGATEIVLGIGGSATCDAGIGCAQACGLPVLLEDREPVSITEPLCGRDVERVVLIKHGRGDKLGGVRIVVACDVTNPLFGVNGAARTFGKQKGATPEQIEQLDQALEQLARRCDKITEANLPGAGAAGGLGFGLVAYFGASLVSGAKVIVDAVDFRSRLARADLCITGEGCFDLTSMNGKIAGTVIELCKQHRKPCFLLVGSAQTKSDYATVRTITDETISTKEAMRRASELLSAAAFDEFSRLPH